MLPNKDISTIESYLLGLLREEEKESFEQRLQAEPKLQEELQAYRELMDGFTVLRQEHFESQVIKWEQEWAGTDTDQIQLIESFLEGELTEQQERAIKKRIREEPVFAKKVSHYQDIFLGFKELKTKEFSIKMEQWEEKEQAPKIVSIDRKKSQHTVGMRVAAAIFLMTFLGFLISWYSNTNYGDQALVNAYYLQPVGETMMGNPQAEIDGLGRQFTMAHELIQEKEYDEAVKAFEAFISEVRNADIDEITKQNYLDNSTWNLVIALIGGSASTAEVKARLGPIRNNPDHEHHDKAVQLYKDLETPWHEIAH